MSKTKDIGKRGVWIDAFVVHTLLNAILSVYVSSQFIAYRNWRNGAQLCFAICYCFFTVFYSFKLIRFFVKRNPNCVPLGMSYLLGSLVVAVSIALFLLGNNMCFVFLGLAVWFVFWLLFLYMSKGVEAIFPLTSRIIRKRDILPAFLIGLFPSMLLLIY